MVVHQFLLHGTRSEEWMYISHRGPDAMCMMRPMSTRTSTAISGVVLVNRKKIHSI